MDKFEHDDRLEPGALSALFKAFPEQQQLHRADGGAGSKLQPLVLHMRCAWSSGYFAFV